MDTLTDKTLSGFIWTFAERFGVQVMQLVIFVILARILTPEAFGLIVMLTIFISLSRSLTDSGFGRTDSKKDTWKADCSTVFYINLVVILLMYVVLF